MAFKIACLFRSSFVFEDMFEDMLPVESFFSEAVFSALLLHAIIKAVAAIIKKCFFIIFDFVRRSNDFLETPSKGQYRFIDKLKIPSYPFFINRCHGITNGLFPNKVFLSLRSAYIF